MRRRLAVMAMSALVVPTLLGCDPAPPPTGFEVTAPGFPLESTEQHVLVRAGDGALWTAGTGAGIDRFDPVGGTHTTTLLPGEVAMTHDLLAGPDGSVLAAVWSNDGFGGPTNGRVVRVGPDMSVETVIELGPDAVPAGLAHDGFDGFWASDGTGDRILRVPFSGVGAEEFDVPSGVGPSALVATGPDVVWFVPAFSPGLGRLDASTGAVEVQPPDPDMGLAMSLSIIVGPHGDLWYTRLGSHGMFRFDPATEVTDAVDGSELWPRELAIGADGGIYATLMCGIDDGLLRVDPVTLSTTTFDVGFSSERQTALGSIVRDGTGFWAVGYPSSGFQHLQPIIGDPA